MTAVLGGFEKGMDMAITGGFGTTMDFERGTARQWAMGRDGVKRWADSGEPVDAPRCAEIEWHPMETAPHDRRLMVWSGQEMYCAHWAQNPMTGDEAWIVAEWGTDGDQALVKPTHWRPLPLPPKRWQ